MQSFCPHQFLNFCLIPLLFTASWCYTIPERYHSYNEMVTELESLNSVYPNITQICTIGFSQVESLPILAMKISDNPAIKEDEPRILFNGIHHSAELMGCEICLYLINQLLVNYDTNALTRRIIDSAEIWLVPIVNPDGHQVVFAGLDSFWRKNKSDNNNNGIFDLDYDGVDLNRNYNFLFDSGGSNSPSSRTYRGPRPFSESESKAMAELAENENFVFDICYHSDKDSSQGERVYYPWRWGNSYAPDYPFIKPVAEELATKIINDLGNGTYTPVLGLVDGGLYRNYLYYAFGTFAYTIEISRSYLPPESKVDSICVRNLAGAYYLLTRIFGSMIKGKVLDALTGNPLRARVRLVEADTSFPIILPRYTDSTFGRFYRIVNPGSYTIEVSKPGYGNKRIGVTVGNTPAQVTIFLAPTSWTQIQSVPQPPDNRKVGAGANLVTVSDSLIYGLKGNNTRDFYFYNTLKDYWCLVDSVPYALPIKKKVKSGAGLVYDQNKYLYLTKGNNTREIWRYALRPTFGEAVWTQLSDVPNEKRLKGGTGLAFVSTETNDFLYLIKGSGTKEFYRFNIKADTWERLLDVPGDKGCKKGSGLAFNQDTLIFLLKGGSKNNEFYAYDIKNSNWQRLASLPLVGNSGKSKRVRDGGALTYGAGRCYALKGGNSDEFWVFYPPAFPNDTGYWIEREPLPILPSNKKVKAGGALVFSNDYVYALKGAKTNEFWVWHDWQKGLSSLTKKIYQSEKKKPFSHLIFSNRQLWLSKIFPIIPANSRLTIYNTLGERVFSQEIGQSLTYSIPLNQLSSGVYFFRLTFNFWQDSKKVIIVE